MTDTNARSRIVPVTGAGSGIGEATARRFAAAGSGSSLARTPETGYASRRPPSMNLSRTLRVIRETLLS
jgi:hypothetical protein